MDKKYELVCIIDPQVGDGGFDPIIEKYQGRLEGQGAEIVNLDKWGLRKLAFTSVSMKRRQQGYYVCYQFTAPSGEFEDIKQELKLDEEVLRYLLLAVQGEFTRVPVLAPDTVYIREREERFSRGRGGPGRPRSDRPDRPPRESAAPRTDAAASDGTAATAAEPAAATAAAGEEKPVVAAAPAATEPAADQPATEPAADQPATEPAADQPAAPESAAAEPASAEPATEKEG